MFDNRVGSKVHRQYRPLQEAAQITSQHGTILEKGLIGQRAGSQYSLVITVSCACILALVKKCTGFAETE